MENRNLLNLIHGGKCSVSISPYPHNQLKKGFGDAPEDLRDALEIRLYWNWSVVVVGYMSYFSTVIAARIIRLGKKTPKPLLHEAGAEVWKRGNIEAPRLGA